MRGTRVNLGDIKELSKLIIRGFEGDDTGGAGGSGGTGEGGTGDDSGAGGSDDGTGSGDDGGDDGEDDGDLPDDAAELKAALKKERLARRAAEKTAKVSSRDAKRLQRAQEDQKAAEEGETAAAKKAAEDAGKRVTALSAKLKQSTLEAAITTAARTAKFRDPDDVITQLQRSNFEGIDIEQDEDDPSDIDIDLKSVERAVKKIAAAKPHWLIAAGETGASGSTFNGGKPGDKQDKATKEKAFAERFPALKNRITR